MRPIWVVFPVHSFLNKGPFFSRFSLNVGGSSRHWQKIVKMDRSPPKFIIKVGMTATVGNKKRVAL